MSFATIDDLRSQLGDAPKAQHSPEYVAKMMHPLPAFKSVDRAAFILGMVKGKRVLEFGATGPMHEKVVAEAAFVWGVDRKDGDGVEGFDLDDVREDVVHRAYIEGPIDLVLCGEVIEHLSNPGWFLTRLKSQYPGVPVLITVPNALATALRAHALKGTENVNADHVAWYTPKTMRTLLERAGYVVKECCWYGGSAPTAEGLIVLAE